MNKKYKYLNNNTIIEFSCKEDKIVQYLKLSLGKNNSNIGNYIKNIGFKIEKCRICNKEYPPIKPIIEIDKNNLITIKGFEYIKKIYCYGTNKNCEGIKMNSNSFEFISKTLNISHEEAIKYLKQNNKSPFYLENHSDIKEYKKSQSRNVDYYINKYGEECGKIKYNDVLKNAIYNRTLDGFIEKYGQIKGEKIYKEIQSKKDSTSYNYFLLKNNYNHKLAIFEFEDRLKKINISLENLIKKYGKKEGTKLRYGYTQKIKDSYNNKSYYEKNILKEKTKININNFIKKYENLELAQIKYDEYLLKTKIPICKASKESLIVFNPLMDYLKNNHDFSSKDFYLGVDKHTEYFIRDKENIFFYDFTITKLKIIIEYNGITFHPKDENSIWENPFNKKITSKEAFNKQQNKINLAIQKGFSVLEIWSDDDLILNYEKCLELVKNKIKNNENS